MIHEINRADHKLVKKIASLKEKKYRKEYGEFLVEGVLSAEWALHSSYEIKTVFLSEDFSLPESLASLEEKKIYRVPAHVFSKMADTKTPQGILCTCALPDRPALPENGLYLYCDDVRDPGNLGSMIRSADALGFRGVLLSPACVDPYNPKLVRSTMGSLFHIDIITDVDAAAIKKLKESGFTLFVSALSDESIPSGELSAGEKSIIAVGNEAKGVSGEVLALADTVVKIPMSGSAESLNVAAAAAILMYEAKSERSAK